MSDEALNMDLFNSDVTEEQLDLAEQSLRLRAKNLVNQIEHTYWELGECLYSVYDGLPGGYRDLMSGDGSRAKRKELFKKWGYKNFGEYCEKEIGIRKRSAENLRYAYYYFEIRLHLPKEIKEQIKALGRSKVYLLAGVVTEDDVVSWIDKARVMTFEMLKEEIKKVRRDNSDSELEGQYAQDAISGVKEELPKPEELHTVQAGLYDTQYSTWEEALNRAKNLSGSEKVGHNLELICQDFLSNNEFKNKKEDDKIAYLVKTERLLGVALIAIDPETGKPVYGSDLLWRMIEEGKGE